MSRVLIAMSVATLTLATACRPATAPTAPEAAAAAPTPAAPVPAAAPVTIPEERLRGQLVIGKDGYGITLCGEQTQRIVGLGPQANALVGAMAESGAREFFVDGFGTVTAGTGQNIARIERATTEGPGCETVAPPFLFKALGTEPFWAVTIAEGMLRLERLDATPLSGDFAGTPMRGDKRQFSTTTSEGPVLVKFERTPCSDGMSDSRYAWTARLTFEGKEWQGCAYAGE